MHSSMMVLFAIYLDQQLRFLALSREDAQEPCVIRYPIIELSPPIYLHDVVTVESRPQLA